MENFLEFTIANKNTKEHEKKILFYKLKHIRFELIHWGIYLVSVCLQVFPRTTCHVSLSLFDIKRFYIKAIRSTILHPLIMCRYLFLFRCKHLLRLYWLYIAGGYLWVKTFYQDSVKHINCETTAVYTFSLVNVTIN